jgi:hypothetical protein
MQLGKKGLTGLRGARAEQIRNEWKLENSETLLVQ